MSNTDKQLSNAASTGGLGIHFENRVQTSFAVLMLTGGYAPCLPTWPIRKIKLQGKYQNYDTDDLIVYAKQSNGGKEAKLLGQIKHSISITKSDKVFGEVIQAAWSDFNNKDVFNQGTDVIALITGPLSSTDTDDVRTLLRQAEHSEDADDFKKRIGLGKFTSTEQRNKLEVFKEHLKAANNNIDLTGEQLWRFLKYFHLLIYDLDIKGVTLSLLHSLIGQYTQENVSALWAQLKDKVEWESENSGVISLDSFSDDIMSAFQKRPAETIPSELAKTPLPAVTVDWKRAKYVSELAIATLLGSWNEKSDADILIASQLANEDFATWISKIREILLQPESPLTLKNGIWAVNNRQELWQSIGQRLFDNNLDVFKQCVVAVLTERDPQFELSSKERYAASIHGKVLKHSHFLRKGLAESLALLGSYPSALNNCTLGKPETVAALAVRDIFDKPDWVLWGSLNNVLPLIAEAAPTEFLSAVETALQLTPCPFDELFSQEGSGVTGGNYLTGLLWALETLAWDAQYLVRVSVILGELASHDPGGNWANRPSNSLTTIFLPWLPQTTATIDKRRVALQTLQKEFPEVAWKIVLSLLPNQQQTSTGSHKPIWRKTIPKEWTKDVTHKEYWDQVSMYADMAVDMAKHDIGKLNGIIGYLDHLPQPAFEKALEHLSSEDVTSKPESERMALWNGLTKFILKHKRYAVAKWALPPTLISKIETVAIKLAPQNPVNLSHRLFSGHDIDLFEENGNWQEQQQKLEVRRQQAIKTILDFAGIDAVIQFAETVEASSNVGLSLGAIADAETDSHILPKLLETENKKLAQFASGFVWSRHRRLGWAWVDKIEMTSWSNAQIGQLLVYLPFTAETWERSQKLLGEFESTYWSKASVNPFQSDSEMQVAIDKLIEYGRPNAAINCLYKNLHDKQPLDNTRTIRALLAAVSSNEPSYAMDTYYIVEIIKALQNDPDINPDDLFRVEWAYLSLLDRDQDAAPKLLENRLASDSSFFHEVIRLVYRSKKEPISDGEPTEQEKSIATNAWRLLHEWQTPPGMMSNGGFSEDHFRRWLESTKVACAESGHLEVALIHVGNVLIHCPRDPDGLWINRAVADALNGKDAEEMRNGFRTAILNSRGVHRVDPTGKPEQELASEWGQHAEDVENAGYQRFAATLKSLAASYEREAERIVDEHKHEDT